MKTITDNNSLIYWIQNENRTNVFVNGGMDMKLFLKPNYVNVFKSIHDALADSNIRYSSIVKLWQAKCMDECNSVYGKVKDLILKKSPNISPNEADHLTQDIVNKFRGNLGEIFAEAFFTSNLMSDVCDGSTYVPVDPTHERFTDADVVSNFSGLKIGIQVKNYANLLVPKEIFDKAFSEDSMRLRLDNMVPKDKIGDYLASPHQMIFSFTDAQDLFIKDNANAIMFFGPKDIDSKNLQGNFNRNLRPNLRFFEKIYTEIEGVE